MRAVTLDDIAAMVGVSAKTVSRVVNHDTRVSSKTRQRVTEAIAQSGYRPNLAARSLVTSRSRLIGIFVPPTGSHFFSELVRSAMRACRELGYNLALEEFDGGRDSPLSIYMAGIRQLRCDGMILPPVVGDDIDLLDQLDRDGVRYVRISPALQLDRSVSINADHAQGAAVVADHFWENGHRRFGLIAGSDTVASGRIRREAFVRALLAKGASTDAITILPIERLAKACEIASTSLIELGRLGGSQLLQAKRPPTAIFTYNDELAAGVVAEAHSLGIEVPKQLSVAGFDDSDVAKLCSPPLTTVRQPIAEIAAKAANLLAATPQKEINTIRCPVSLILRQSTGPACANAARSDP